MTGKTKWIRMTWMAAALLPLLAGVAGANQPVPPVDNEHVEHYMEMEQAREFHPRLEKANKLIGAKVVDTKGDRLGTIEDIVLTPDRKAVSYAVLAYGGFMGMGGKFFAVPWSAFDVKVDKSVLILDADKTALESAKGFDKDHWPAAAEKDWLGLGRDRGGPEPMAAEPAEDEGAGEVRERPEAAPTEPGAKTATDIRYRRLSRLVGMTVYNLQGEALGELENIVLDLHEGKVAYAILSMRSGFLNLDKDYVAIPWSSLDILERLGTARLDADRETLRAIAFEDKDFPNLEDMQYSRELHERFGATPYWEALGYVPGEGREDVEHRELSPWKEGSKYDSLYNPGNTRTLEGTIESVGTFRLEGTPIMGLRLRVRTDEGKTVTVHAGPRPYVDRQNITFHYGDRVTVTGSPAQWGWRNIIIASQIKMGNKTLDLRTREGKPHWNVDEFMGSR